MTAFRVNLDELDHVISRLTALGKILTDELGSIDSQVKQLHSSSWSGIAAAAHAEAHAQWAQSATEFNEGVQEMRDVARHAHEQYAKAHTTNVNMLR